MFAAIPFGSLLGVANPAMQALLSRTVGPSEQGQLQGVVQSLRGLSGMIGPVLYTQLFAVTLHTVPGAAYGLAAVLIVGSMLVALAVGRKVPSAPVVATATPAGA